MKLPRIETCDHLSSRVNLQTQRPVFRMILFVFLVVVAVQSGQGSICERTLDETVCQNFTFAPSLSLNSFTRIVAIKRAKGAIVRANFADLDDVSELLLSDNSIGDVEPATLCSPPKLSSLVLSRNEKFPKLTGAVLKGCETLRKLYVDNCRIESGAFGSMKNLATVTINGSIFTENLSSSSFEGLDVIESLTIRHSPIGNLGKPFDNLKNLRFLDLQSDGIESLENGVFGNLNGLKVLDLSFSRLDNLTWKEFEGLEELQVLYLEGNDFVEIDVAELLKHVSKIERMFLGTRRFSEEARKVVDGQFLDANVTLIWLSG